MSENYENNNSEELDEEIELTPTQKKIKELLGMVFYVAAVFLICFLIITYVGQRTQVSGSSMEATLSDGDNLIIDKLSYKLHDPERFDIIVFPYQYEENTFYIKRIIGLPGETVWINDMGDIYINGVLLKENYGMETINYPGAASEPIILGADEYFVLGDNRNNSTDSRMDSVGEIKRENIVGKAWVRIYPFDEITFIKHQ